MTEKCLSRLFTFITGCVYSRCSFGGSGMGHTLYEGEEDSLVYWFIGKHVCCHQPQLPSFCAGKDR